MLTSLTMHSWKSYKESSLYLDPITVLIGTNASGKSNVLDALQFLNRIATGVMLTPALQGDSLLPSIRGGLEWAPHRPGDGKFELGVVISKKNEENPEFETDYEYLIECQIQDKRCEVLSETLNRTKYRITKKNTRTQIGVIKILRTDSCDAFSPTITARLYNEKQGTPRQMARTHCLLFQLLGQKTRQEIQEGVQIVSDALKSIFILDPIPNHMRGYSQFSENLNTDASNIAGVIAALNNDEQKNIETQLSEFAKKLPERDIVRVFAEAVGKFQADAMLYCEEQWHTQGDPHVIDARGMSDGTLRFLAIVSALLTRPKESLLVVEEVDNGLHPSRSKLLLDMLTKLGKERNVDVLVTTHNPALLDAMGNQMVPFITVAHRDPNTGESRLTLLEDVEQLPKLLAEGSIGKLSSQGKIEKALQLAFDFL